MVEIQSTNEDGARPETRASSKGVPSSPFKIYLEQNPEMANQLFKVMLQLY